MTFSLTFILEVITVIQKIRKRNLWLIKIAVIFRLSVSGIAALLGFLGIIWAILGTTNDGGGWGRGIWSEFIDTQGREWKIWFGNKIGRIAILMWLGTVVHLSIAAAMNDELLHINSSLDDKTVGKKEAGESVTELPSKKSAKESSNSPTEKNATKKGKSLKTTN